MRLLSWNNHGKESCWEGKKSKQATPTHPQAVAVVVSLKDARKKVGVFRLTEPNGLQLIQQ